MQRGCGAPAQSGNSRSGAGARAARTRLGPEHPPRMLLFWLHFTPFGNTNCRFCFALRENTDRSESTQCRGVWNPLQPEALWAPHPLLIRRPGGFSPFPGLQKAAWVCTWLVQPPLLRTLQAPRCSHSVTLCGKCTQDTEPAAQAEAQHYEGHHCPKKHILLCLVKASTPPENCRAAFGLAQRSTGGRKGPRQHKRQRRA